MTVFSNNQYDRRMERLMMTVPNFAPRGVGFRFTEAQLFITTTAATPTEILTATMRQIRCPPFRKRFNEYIESEENPMTYINEKHRARFELAAKNIAKANYALLSALYLLTADQRLWSCCKHHINNGCVFFETKEAQVLYTLALYDHSKADGFVDKLVGCFAEDQTDEQLIAAVNSAFGTELKAEDYSKIMNSIRANSINTSGFTDPHRRKHIAKGCYDGNHGNRQSKHRGTANIETAYRYGIRGRKEQ